MKIRYKQNFPLELKILRMKITVCNFKLNEVYSTNTKRNKSTKRVQGRGYITSIRGVHGHYNGLIK